MGTGSTRSKHFDIVRQNGQFAQLHGSVLCKLLGVIGGGASLEDDSIVPHDDAEVANATAETALDQKFEVFFGSHDGLRDTIGVHNFPIL